MGVEIGRRGGSEIYAIVRSGGKQYRVEPDQIIDVDRLPVEVGSTVDLVDVLLIAVNGDVDIGRPTLEGARVVTEVVEHGRDAKLVVFKYKAKTRYHRRRGHHRGYTRLAVRQILAAEGPTEAEEKPKRRRAAKTEAEAKPARRPRRRKPEPAAEETVVEAPEAEAKPARRRRARKVETEAASAEAPAVEAPEGEAKPARRRRAPKAETKTPSAEALAAEAPEVEAKPARRSRARKPASEGEAENSGKAPRRSARKIETESD